MDCLHVLDIVNNAAMSTEVCVSFPIIIFLYIPRAEFSGHMVILFLVLWEISILFFTAAAPNYIPTHSIPVYISVSIVYMLPLYIYIKEHTHTYMYVCVCSFLMINIVINARSYIIVVLICIFLMISEDGQLFICL